MRLKLSVLAAALFSVAAMLSWFAGLGRPEKNLSDESLSRPYIHALAKWQAHLPISPHPSVLAANDPFTEPEAKQHLLGDASYFEGKYYVYFGIVPFATVLVPWFWLTGVAISPAAAVIFFSLTGCAAYGIMLLRFAHATWPGLRSLWFLAAYAVIVVASGTWPLLGRPAIYEIENSAAYAFLALALLSLFHAEIGIKHAVNLPLAAGFAALVMGCRPNYFPAVSLVALWVIVRAWQFAPTGISRAPRAVRVLASILPFLVVGASLAWWNYHRFGTPMQFGLKYTVSQDPSVTRALTDSANIPYSLYRYLFGGAHFSPYFPFIQAPNEGPVPMGPEQEPSNQLYGILMITPVLIGAAFAFRMSPPVHGAFLGMLLMLFLGNLSFLARIPMSSYRYPADFLGPLTLVAAVGWLRILAVVPGWRRLLVGSALIVILGWSLAAVICQTFSIAQTHTDFDMRRAGDFARVAKPFNRLAYAIQDFIDRPPAAVAMTVSFPSKPSGPNEPLVVMGSPGAQDFLFVNYIKPGVVALGFESTGHGGLRSSQIEIDPGRPHRVEMHCGSLMPPDDHPLLRGLATTDLELARELLMVTLDGKVVIDGPVRQHRPRGIIEIGRSPDNSAFGAAFTGEIRAERASLNALVSTSRWKRDDYGPLHLRVKLVPLPAGVCDPLFSIGLPGRGGQLLAEHQPDGSIRLIWLDSTGRLLEQSVSNWPMHQPIELEVWAGSLMPPPSSSIWPTGTTDEYRRRLRRLVRVKLNGATILEGEIDPVDSAPALLALGRDTLYLRGGVMPASPGTVEVTRLPWP